MIKRIDINNKIVAEKVLALQLKSYETEANIIGYDDLPPLKETIDDIISNNDKYYGYFNSNKLIGFIAIESDKNITISKLVVDPDYFNKGIASKLIYYIEEISKANTVKVSTGAKNIPAINLYLKHGFIETETKKINNKLHIKVFKKEIE